MDTANTSTSVEVNGLVLDLASEKKTNVLEQMAQLQRFTGADPYYPIHKFKRDFEECAKWFGWSEEDQFFILKKKLGGKAASIYDIFEDKISTSQELFNKLEERLGRDIASADKFQNLRDFRQTPDMPVEDFITLARKKAYDAAKAHRSIKGENIDEVAEEWLLNMLFDNVLPQYRREILRANPTTSDEFEKLALLEEKAWRKTKNFDPPDPLVCAAVAPDKEDKMLHLISEINNKMKDLAVKVEMLEKEKRGQENQREYKEITCFRCNQKGHIARNCLMSDRNTHQNIFRGRGGYGHNTYRGGQGQNRYRNNYRDNQQYSQRGYYNESSRGRGNGNRPGNLN